MVDGTKQVTASGRRKPPAAGMGRKKGSVNKITKTIRQAVEMSFNEIGGSDWLVKMADVQPAAYMTLLGKVLPQQMDHTSSDGSMTPRGLDASKLSSDALREVIAAANAPKPE